MSPSMCVLSSDLPLCDDDAEAEERSGLLQGHKCEQVHTLVLRLLKQRVDPSGEIHVHAGVVG